MIKFVSKYGPAILVAIAVVTLLINIRQTQLLSKECDCKKDEIGPI